MRCCPRPGRRPKGESAVSLAVREGAVAVNVPDDGVSVADDGSDDGVSIPDDSASLADAT
jgi:hypothetical protein